MKRKKSGTPLADFLVQRGIVLFTVLIALVVISLSAVALIRSVDTGVVIAGNLAFRQASTQAGDAGTEAAFSWLKESVEGDIKNLYASSPDNGYYATWMGSCDVTGNSTADDLADDVDWDGAHADNGKCNMKASSVPGGELPAGYQASYVINRLCQQEGDPFGIVCEQYSNSDALAEAGLSMAGGGYAKKVATGPTRYFYRVTTRVVGPRNTVSIVQSVLLN